MLGYTPTQTGSREISQRRTVRRASLVRRGLSMSFEHDFVKTALGRTSYLIGLGQIARSIQETANAEVSDAFVCLTNVKLTCVFTGHSCIVACPSISTTVCARQHDCAQA